jgi:tetratricopeptide (TPR) repeat protein/DNA-binding winged helix-turn-helix (wHTH) protein
MPHLDVRLLGPLELRVDGVPVAIPRGNTATVLAILLDEANSVVPLESIVRAVYGIDIPQDPETQVQNTIGVLRRKLGAARDRVETVGRAYRFRIETQELDTLRCRANEDRSRALRTEGRLDEAVAALREALGEWRGPALANLSGTTVDSIRRRYDEHRLALLDRRIDLDLELGRAAEVVDELRQIVAVYTGILRDPPAGPAAPAASEAPFPRRVPAMLPRANTRFTGRTGQMRLLDGFLEAAEGAAGLAVITGMGGVGKTALAVSWAHRVAHRFPDGQLYFNLRGFDPLAPGADAATVLGEALVALGVEAHRLPTGLDERIGLYRTVLAGRSVLVVLDNARDAAAVRPLLPVAPGSFTLVTSRDRLSGLDATEGADVVPLELLSDADAWALLVRRIGRDRAMTEERAVLRIVASCGRLPLALTLIGAWAAAHPQFSLASLADRLDTTTNVFRVLASSDLASDPRSVFACSYQALGSRAARAFRLFGLHPGPDLTVPAMASLMGVPPADAEAALHELADVHLIDQHQEGRYTMHDLLRAYAAERLKDEVDPPHRRAAEARMLDYFVHSTHLADTLLTLHGGGLDFGEPGPGVTPESIADLPAAAAWFKTEYDVLRGLLQRETEPEDDASTWRLGWCLAGYMVDRSFARDLFEAQTAALAAAERADDGFGQVVSLGYLSGAMVLLADEAAASHYLERAMNIADELDQPWAKGFVHYALTVLAGRRNRDDEAAAFARRARDHFRDAGDLLWEYRATWAIGGHTARQGRLDEARECFDRILAGATAHGLPPGVANANLGYGLIAHQEHRFEEALEHYAQAIAVFIEYHVEASAAFVRELVGDTLAAQGDPAAAYAEWRSAERVYAEFGAITELDRIRGRLEDPELRELAELGARPPRRPHADPADTEPRTRPA